MKTITLEEAYAKSPTAPLLNNDQHKIQPNLPLLISSVAGNPETAALLAHSFNVLPELVEALQEMVNEKVEGPFFNEDEHEHPECALSKARSALDKANKVQLP